MSVPSKGGRHHASPPPTSVIGGYVESVAASIDESAVVAPPSPSQSPFSIADAELDRALRRGVEVGRFNELARQQNELTPNESDELYGYRLRRLRSRLRRLDRILVSDDEEAIRTEFEDFDARLQELRSLEQTRQVAGLSIAEPVDLSARQAAIDRLLELSRRRPPGLIAGADSPPRQPTGNIRLRQVAFRPTAEDVSLYILTPSSIPSDALARNVEAVASQGAHVRLVNESSQIPRHGEHPPLVLNWGSTQPLPSDLISLNRPEGPDRIRPGGVASPARRACAAHRAPA